MRPLVVIISIIIIVIVAAEKVKQKTAYVGQTLRLQCHTTLDFYVDWRRLETLRSDHHYIYFNGHVTEPFQSRFSVEVTTLDPSDLYTLVIADVQLDDSMYYLCIEDAGFGNRHFFHLNVTGTRCDIGSVDFLDKSSCLL